jgi:hypothetical protein
MSMLGWKESPAIPGELLIDKFGSVDPIRPPRAHDGFKPLVKTIHTQRYNNCVGWLWSQMLYYRAKWLNPDVSVDFASANYIYWYSRELHFGTQVDDGTFIHTAAEAIKSKGVCSAEFWPEDERSLTHEPNWNARRMATDQRDLMVTHGFQWARILDQGDFLITQIQRCLSQGIPVGYGQHIWREWEINQGELITAPKQPSMIGGHAMMLAWYDEAGVYIPQTWGNLVGNSGIYHVSWDVITRFGSSFYCMNVSQPHSDDFSEA